MKDIDQLYKDNVFPDNYRPPQPRKRYDLVVIGGGTAGLVTAAGAAGLGADVALVEAGAMGGDCLNVGCVPSKALIAAARDFYRQQREGGEKEGGEPFRQGMESVRRKRAAISVHDSVARFTDLGVDVFLAKGRFTGEGTIQAGDTVLQYKKAVIATGARAQAPPIPGLDRLPYLTNENLFELQERPASLIIIGGGPIGVEMAQAFQRFGTQVHLVEVAPKILIREDRQAAEIVEQVLLNEGVKLFTGATIKSVSGDGNRQRMELTHDGQTTVIESDRLLVAAGRMPNSSGLGLEHVGVELTERKMVRVNDMLRTTNPKIYACGDIASPYQFTHAADFLARTVLRNSLFFGRRKASSLLIPWVTYSEPEIAHVGAYGHELDKKGVRYEAYKLDFDQVDRAVLEEQQGFCEILADPKKGKIYGATMVHDHAGDMISQITLAMQHNITLGRLADVIHPYPTQAEIIRKLGDLYNRGRLTPVVAKVLKFVLKL